MIESCQVEQIVRDFDRAWSSGAAPQLADYINRLRSEDARRGELLRLLIGSDLEFGWKQGSGRRLEEYLREWPEIGGQDDLSIELIEMEWAARSESDPEFDGTEYQRRFPRQWSHLETRLTPRTSVANVGENDEAGAQHALKAEGRPVIPGHVIENEIARGGMGVVYKARHLGLNRLVAVKMILAGVHAGREQVARFRGEAEAVARLQHPNIVQVFEIGEHCGLPYFSLEFVSGGSLDKTLAGAPQNPQAAAKLTATLAEAVHAAHRANVVHRDLKPANVLLTAEGIPKVTDFGLAKQLDASDGQTKSGAIMGTPCYMAPEQASGSSRRIGPATDIYALGAILYEMLTGRPPFRAETPLDTVMLVIAEEPLPVRQLQPKTPVDLETICLKCLRKEPSKRYATAGELADDLRRFQAGKPVLALPVGRLERGWKWVKRNPVNSVLGMAIAISLICGAGGIYLKYLDEQTQKEKANSKAYDLEIAVGERDIALTNAKTEEEKAKIEERNARRHLDNGRVLLAQADWAQNNCEAAIASLMAVAPEHRSWEWHYLFRNYQEPALFTLQGHKKPITRALISSDGRRIATASEDKVLVWDAGTGKLLFDLKDATNARPLSKSTDTQSGKKLKNSSPTDRPLAINANGSHIVVGDLNQAWLWNCETGKVLFELQNHFRDVKCVAISADASRIVTGTLDGNVCIWDGTTGKVVCQIKEHLPALWALAINGDGTRLVTGYAQEAWAWDAKTGKKLFTMSGLPGLTTSISTSNDLRRIVIANGLAIQRDTVAFVFDGENGQRLFELFGHTDVIHSVAVTPDGSRIVTGSSDNTTRVWDGKSGMPIRQIRGNRSKISGVSIASDGTRIVTCNGITKNRPNLARVWNALEELPSVEFRRDKATIGEVAIAPEGDAIATATIGDMNLHEVWIWDAKGVGAIVELKGHAGSITCIRFVPNSKKIVTTCEDGQTRIWDVQTGRLIRILEERSNPILTVAVSPDGTRLVTGGKDGVVRVWDIDAGQSLLELKGHNGEIRCSTFSVDGNLIVTGSADDTIRIWDAQTGLPGVILKDQIKDLHSLAISPDSSTVVSGDGYFIDENGGRPVLVWDVKSGQLKQKLAGHLGAIQTVTFTPDGQRIISGSRDRTVRIWDLQTGASLFVLKGHSDVVGSLALNNDGTRLVTGSRDSTARIWEALIMSLPAIASSP